MAVYERAEKILARSHHHCPSPAWSLDRIRWKQCRSAFHLYIVLTMSFRTDVRRLIGASCILSPDVGFKLTFRGAGERAPFHPQSISAAL